MSFLIGLFIGLGLSSKGSRPSVGIQFMTVEEAMSHKDSLDPFAAQDAFQQSAARTALRAPQIVTVTGEDGKPEDIAIP